MSKAQLDFILEISAPEPAARKTPRLPMMREWFEGINAQTPIATAR